MTGFLAIRSLTSDTPLTNAMEDLFDSALIISRRSRKGTIQMLDSFIFILGSLVTEDTVSHLVRQEALSTLNCILNVAPWDERKKLSLAEGTQCLVKEFARTILTVGDYNYQTATTEAMCRMTTRSTRDKLVHQWFDDEFLAEAFKNIKNREFETDCRKFLNLLNDRLGEQRRVYSLPCIAAFADAHEMRKPADEKLEEFWVDFNLGSRSITFYIDNAETDLWEPVQLWKEAVLNFSITESEKTKTLRVYLGQPVSISKREAKTVEFHFDVRLNVLLASFGALGGDKQILPDQVKISPQLTRTFEEKHRETATSRKGQTEKEEGSTNTGFMGAEDDRCLITLRWNDLREPPTTNAAASSETREADRAKQGFQEPVQSQVSKLDDTSRGESAFEGNRKEERRIPLSSEKYFFSESDQDSSPSTSEQSWMTTRKRKSLKSYSRRRKLRVSSLKILPLSPVSFSPKKDHIVTQKPSVENSIQHKLQYLADREMPDGNFAVPKQSGSEEGSSGFPILADISAASPEDITENFCGSALSMTFENFTKELKRKYQEESPLHSEKSKKAPECLIKLWEQINLCRLDKLEKFHSCILQEWRNLEVDMRTLRHLEEDALEYWEKQGADMNSFCDMQLPRLNLSQPS